MLPRHIFGWTIIATLGPIGFADAGEIPPYVPQAVKECAKIQIPKILAEPDVRKKANAVALPPEDYAIVVAVGRCSK